METTPDPSPLSYRIHLMVEVTCVWQKFQCSHTMSFIVDMVLSSIPPVAFYSGVFFVDWDGPGHTGMRLSTLAWGVSWSRVSVWPWERLEISLLFRSTIVLHNGNDWA